MTWWFAVLLVLCGAVAGVVAYVLWSSRATHSEHSNYDAATSVRAVQARVMGDRWAERNGYAALEPADSAEDNAGPLPRRQRPYVPALEAAETVSPGETTGRSVFGDADESIPGQVRGHLSPYRRFREGGAYTGKPSTGKLELKFPD